MPKVAVLQILRAPARRGLLLAAALAAACAPSRSAAPPAAPADRGGRDAPGERAEHRSTPRTGRAAVALAAADTLRVAELAPGVRHVYAWDGAGPWAIHLVEVDAAVCAPRIAAVKAGPPLSARAKTSALAAGALAAMNADFFAIPGGTPVEAHVRGGVVLAGPGARGRPVFAVADGAPRIGTPELEGAVVARSDTLRLGRVNRTGGDSLAVGLYTHWYGTSSPAGEGGVAAAVRRVRGTASNGVGVVVTRDTAGGALPLDTARVVLRAAGAAAGPLARWAPGDTVAWRARVVVDGARVEEAVGGYPVLVRGGRIVPEAERGTSEAFGARRHPRTAVGVTGDGELLWVVVDGRQAPYSAGMSLGELAVLMQRLGAREALNLDGGGSTALVARGRVLNRPSDAAGERPVGNALVLEGCGAAG